VFIVGFYVFSQTRPAANKSFVDQSKGSSEADYLPDDLANVITLDLAVKNSIKKTRNNTPVSLELLNVSGGLSYIVGFKNGQKSEVHAYSGAVLNVKSGLPIAGKRLPRKLSVFKSPTEIQKTAKDLMKKEKVLKMRLENRNNVWQYVVTIDERIEVYINATTADIITIKNG